eukprot:scaffold77120_cov54-Phaeocystis_antarctica.AAC.2
MEQARIHYLLLTTYYLPFTTHTTDPFLPTSLLPWSRCSRRTMLEKNGRLLPPDVRVIHVVRDPRDSCVSLFHQVRE